MHAPLQPKADVAPRRAVPLLVHDVVTSPGRPLDRSVRSFMEPRFGADFGSVPVRTAPPDAVVGDPGRRRPGRPLRAGEDRHAVAGHVTGMRSVAPTAGRADFSGVHVHADERAAESARGPRQGEAYTLGPHIVFGQGEYAPHSPAGRELLAHELSHVVQQSTGRPRIQGRWRLDRTIVDDRRESSITDENGDTMSMGSGGGGAGFVYGRCADLAGDGLDPPEGGWRSPAGRPLDPHPLHLQNGSSRSATTCNCARRARSPATRSPEDLYFAGELASSGGGSSSARARTRTPATASCFRR